MLPFLCLTATLVSLEPCRCQCAHCLYSARKLLNSTKAASGRAVDRFQMLEFTLLWFTTDCGFLRNTVSVLSMWQTKSSSSRRLKTSGWVSLEWRALIRFHKRSLCAVHSSDVCKPLVTTSVSFTTPQCLLWLVNNVFPVYLSQGGQFDHFRWRLLPTPSTNYFLCES